MQITARFLHIPIRNGAPAVTVRLTRQGQLLREFRAELALDAPPDWTAFYDISAFAGEALELETDPALAEIETLLAQSDDLPAMPDLYEERFRPQFHYTARRGWNNDPNGLVYHNGLWHMYYQHNPFGVAWGNMHWGHATSPDLLHWTERPEALYQNSLLDMAFSGGGFLATPDGKPGGAGSRIHAAFTSTGRGECLLYSPDGGQTLLEPDGNPLITQPGRDPKILWYAPQEKWLLVRYEELDPADTSPAMRGYAFYDSGDLRAWRRLSFQPGWWECPEFFQLPLDGEDVWVLYGGRWDASKPAGLGARSAFQIGRFDGSSFTPLAPVQIAHLGPNFYAAQCFSNVPDGRVLMLGWMIGANYTNMPFAGGMTVPLELSLRRIDGTARLCFQPAREVEALREAGVPVRLEQTAEGGALALPPGAELLDLTLNLTAAGPLTLDLRGHSLTYDPASGALTFAGETGSLPPAPNLALRILIDRCVTEVFAQGGLLAFSAMTPENGPERLVVLTGASAEGMAYPLRGAWQEES